MIVHTVPLEYVVEYVNYEAFGWNFRATFEVHLCDYSYFWNLIYTRVIPGSSSIEKKANRVEAIWAITTKISVIDYSHVFYFSLVASSLCFTQHQKCSPCQRNADKTQEKERAGACVPFVRAMSSIDIRKSGKSVSNNERTVHGYQINKPEDEFTVRYEER